MSAPIDIQSVLFPYLYNAPSELKSYTPKAIRQVAQYLTEGKNFKKSDYATCEAFKDVQEEVFGLWWPIWNHDDLCYPVEGSLDSVLQELAPSDAYSEMYWASLGRFTSILEQVAYAVYPNTGEASQGDVRNFIHQRFTKMLSTQEEEQEEEYGM